MSVEHKTHSVRGRQLQSAGITPPEDWNDIAQVRAVVKREIGAACTAVIYAGVEVAGKRYSLTEHDQTELMAQLQSVKEGAAAIPYHADGELCRLYTAEEFAAVAQAAMAHIFYNRTYCNHLNAWIKRATLKQLATIKYGTELPKDLADAMGVILAAAGGEAS